MAACQWLVQVDCGIQGHSDTRLPHGEYITGEHTIPSHVMGGKQRKTTEQTSTTEAHGD